MYIHTYMYVCVILHACICSTATTAVGVVDPAPWPLRNSQVFYSVNATMERCNDLMELVHTIHDFRYDIRMYMDMLEGKKVCIIIDHISFCLYSSPTVNWRQWVWSVEGWV